MVRVGTNLPCVVQEGCNLLVGGAHVTAADLATVRRLLTYLGGVEDVQESLINAINAVSGCGPAYVRMTSPYPQKTFNIFFLLVS